MCECDTYVSIHIHKSGLCVCTYINTTRKYIFAPVYIHLYEGELYACKHAYLYAYIYVSTYIHIYHAHTDMRQPETLNVSPFMTADKTAARFCSKARGMKLSDLAVMTWGAELLTKQPTFVERPRRMLL